MITKMNKSFNKEKFHKFLIYLLLIILIISCNKNTVEANVNKETLYPKGYGEFVKAEMPNSTGFNRCWFYYVNDELTEKSYPRILWCKD